MISQINHLGKMSPVLRVSTHIFGVSKEIDGKMFIFIAILKAHIGRSIGRSNLARSVSSSEWPFLIFIVKAHTIRWQIYQDEVFYMKDLLPMRVTISFPLLVTLNGLNKSTAMKAIGIFEICRRSCTLFGTCKFIDWYFWQCLTRSWVALIKPFQ